MLCRSRPLWVYSNLPWGHSAIGSRSRGKMGNIWTHSPLDMGNPPVGRSHRTSLKDIGLAGPGPGVANTDGCVWIISFAALTTWNNFIAAKPELATVNWLQSRALSGCAAWPPGLCPSDQPGPQLLHSPPSPACAG